MFLFILYPKHGRRAVDHSAIETHPYVCWDLETRLGARVIEVTKPLNTNVPYSQQTLIYPVIVMSNV